MKITGFQIFNYRSIVDSGWVDVENVTVLIGKNESGKTSILRALHKFRPFKPDPYLIDKEWPRASRQNRDPEAVVCRVGLALEEAEFAELSAVLDDPARQRGPFVVARTYSGEYRVELPAENFPPRPAKSKIPELTKDLLQVTLPIGTAISPATFSQCSARVLQYARAGDAEAIAQAGKDIPGLLLATVAEPSQADKTVAASLAATVTELSHRLKGAITTATLVQEFVLGHLPTFIYMDDYRAFRGAALLDQLKARRDAQALTEEDRTFIAMLDLSGLDLDAEVARGRSLDDTAREQRLYDLNDAGLRLSRGIGERWKQRRYEVEFRVDGQAFFTMVRDETGPYLIPLEDRSKGFQWFFSFDLMFMYESARGFKGCVLLLDEPGLHLHANAQRDLLARLEEYAVSNSLIYTTHLPFMIDVARPSRIRTISETANGTVVDTALAASQPDAKLALEAALAAGTSAGYLLARRNLILVGLDDFIILQELSSLLVRSDQVGLAEDIRLTVSGGIREAALIAALMIGRDLSAVVLLGADARAAAQAEQLVKSWSTRYGRAGAVVLRMGEVLDADEECAIEDLFPESYYLDKVHKVYAQELTEAGISRLKLDGGGRLAERVERAMQQEAGIRFSKSSVARAIRSEFVKMPHAAGLPSDVRGRAAKLFGRINAAFA